MRSRVVTEMLDAAKSPFKTRAEATAAFDAVFRAVEITIRSEGRAIIPNFGTFRLKQREEKTMRNPKTGDIVKLAAHKVVTFKMSKPR